MIRCDSFFLGDVAIIRFDSDFVFSSAPFSRYELNFQL